VFPGAHLPLHPLFYRFSLEVIVLPCMGLILEISRRPPPDRSRGRRPSREISMSCAGWIKNS
jgi:hypothetical protein